MGQITSLFVRKVVQQVHPSLDRRALLESVGVDPDTPVDLTRMVEDVDYYALLERIARTDPNATDLPLRTGASMRCDDYAAFGLAWKSAVNLRGSYERAERYARLLTSISTYEVRDATEGVCLHLHREGERRLGLRLSNEATLASLASLSQQVSTTRFQPLAVYFRHPSPGSASAHERHFGCPVRFGTDRDALLLSRETLLTPNRLGDDGTSRFFDSHLEAELKQLGHEESLDSRVRAQVSRSLSEGLPRISDVARRLGMSGRTLQRRLSDSGHSYNALVDESRRQLAERLLRQTGYSLAEVAFLTGFSEQSAFTRAFKRWTGQTPRSFRTQGQRPPV
jgi:AraC-like DNA-binding protein